jgi:hypothetical protein
MSWQEIEEVRRGVFAYLGIKYSGDLTWHPLFTAVREWWMWQYDSLQSK